MDCQEDFPLRQRNRIDELVEECIEKLGNDIHSMLCDQNSGEDYRGLDSDRDTEAEVETALRHFPEVVSRGGGRYNLHPIYSIMFSGAPHFNLKALPFVAIIARVGIEFGSLDVEQRGGLMDSTSNPEGYNERVDHLCLTQLIRLRQMGIIKKEDIHHHNLVYKLFVNHYFFSERRFRFLVEWDPTVLTETYNYGRLLLHHATRKCTFHGFQVVFNYVIRYYPKKSGVTLLFKKTNSGVTPFQSVCKKYGITAVLEVVEEVLTRYHSQETTKLDFIEAFLSAAINENLHLDCAYFLLRRQPDVLVRLLSGSHNNDDGIDDGGDNANLDDDINRKVNHETKDGNNNDDRSWRNGADGGGVDDGGGNGNGNIKDCQHNGVVVVKKRKGRV